MRIRSSVAIAACLCLGSFEASRSPAARPLAGADSTASSLPEIPLAAAPAEQVYVPGRHLVRAPAGADLDAMTAAVGARVVQPTGRSGWAVVEGSERAIAALGRAGASAAPLGRTVGAGSKNKPAVPTGWHLDVIDPPAAGDLSGWVVAVLDTGVAYETTGAFVQVPGLAGVTFVDPADFVEGDGHPNDDHQHGTHVTSLIASTGAYPGVAPGVSVMPVKVLDATNAGSEWALVEGIHHAVDHGADVINLSLSFPLGYVPSPALAEALERAYSEDVVMVASAGNDGQPVMTWPAASRLVVAVSASPDDSDHGHPLAEYSNFGPRADVIAPGGSIGDDADHDGFVDGIVAETIDPADPSVTGLWFYQGTSQAAAMVTGAAVHLLAEGVAPRDVGPTLQREDFDSKDADKYGTGAVVLDVQDAIDQPAVARDWFVGLLPYVIDDGDPAPRARVVVVDEDGVPVDDVWVVGSIHSEDGTEWDRCKTDDDGVCVLEGDDTATATAWAFQIDAVEDEDVAQRPSKAVFTSDGGAVLLAALDDPALGFDALGVYWAAGDDPELDAELVESWAVVDVGTGLLSSPVGLVFLPGHVSGSSTPGTIALDVDATGLLSSPVGGLVVLPTLTLTGGGLLSSPVGLRIVGLSGSGLLSSPVGFHAAQLFTGTGLLSSPVGSSFVGQPILLDTGRMVGSSVVGTPFESTVLDGRGSRTADGYEPATLILGSGAVSLGLPSAPDSVDASSFAVGTRWVP